MYVLLKINLVTSCFMELCGTQHLIVSLTQTQTSPIYGPQDRLCPQNKNMKGGEEGISLNQGGEDEEHFLSGAALSMLICCSIHSANPRATCRFSKNVCVAFFFSRNLPPNNIATNSCAPGHTLF